VSAWAGLHYFASRHGFQAPGDEAAEGEREGRFTWPEGNGWLVRRLAAPLGDRLHGRRTVLQVTEAKHGVEVVVWNETTAAIERWSAPTVVLAVPLFVSARLLAAPPTALLTATKLLSDAPWLVANVHIDRPLLDRPGAPPSWDNVAYASGVPGSDGLNALRGQRGRLRFVHSDLCGSSVFEEAFSVGTRRPWAEAQSRASGHQAVSLPTPVRASSAGADPGRSAGRY